VADVAAEQAATRPTAAIAVTSPVAKGIRGCIVSPRREIVAPNAS